MKINDDKLDELFKKSRLQQSEYSYESIEEEFLKRSKTNKFNLKKWFIMSTIAIIIGVLSAFYFSVSPNKTGAVSETTNEVMHKRIIAESEITKESEIILTEAIHKDGSKETIEIVENSILLGVLENKNRIDGEDKTDNAAISRKTKRLNKSKTPDTNKIIGYHQRFQINRNSTEEDLKSIQKQANEDGLFFEYRILREREKVDKIILNLSSNKEIGICSSEAAIEFDDNDDSYSFGWDKNDRGEVTNIDIEDTISVSANRFKSSAFSNKQCANNNDENSQKRHVFYFTRQSSERDFELIKDSAGTFGIEMKYKLKEKNSILNKVSLELKFENENTNGAFTYIGTYDEKDSLKKKHYFGWIEDAENNIIKVTTGSKQLIPSRSRNMLFSDSLQITQLTTLEEFENFKSKAAKIGLEFTYKTKYNDGKIISVDVELESFDKGEKNINCSAKYTSNNGISEFSIGYFLNAEGKVVKVGSNRYHK